MIDEAHSSQSGRTLAALSRALSTAGAGLGGDDAVPTVAEAEPELASLVAESIAFPKDRLVDPALARPAGEAGTRGLHGGFNLHAGTTVGAHDTAARERLCQYLLRPPISDDRLTALPDGRVSLALKRLSSSPASRPESCARGRTS